MLITLKTDKILTETSQISKTETGYAEFVNSSSEHNQIYARFKQTLEHDDLRIFLNVDEVNIIDESKNGIDQLYEIPY